MKQYSRQYRQINQAKSEASSILGCNATLKKLKTAYVFLLSSQKFDDSFQSNQTIADIANCGLTTVKETKQEMIHARTLALTQRHAPTPSRIVLLEGSLKEEAKRLLQLVFGEEECERIRNALRIVKRPLLSMSLLFINAPLYSGTPRPAADCTWAESYVQHYQPEREGATVNSLSSSEWDAIWDSTRRPDSITKTTRPPDEAPTQKQGAFTLKRESYDSTIQSNTGLYPGDYRTKPDKMGPDEALCLSRSSDTRCETWAQAQQAGSRPLCALLQNSLKLLPSEQSRDSVPQSSVSFGYVQDAYECPDDIAYGYEGEWAEVFD